MYRSKSDAPSDTVTLLQQVEYFRQRYFKSDPVGFKRAVHDALYRSVNLDFQTIRENATLAAIGALVMASRRGSVSEVVSFNYDNLIELYLSYHGFVAASIAEEKHWRPAADVTVFHPHGFLPYDCEKAFSKEIVLDQESYSVMLGDKSKIWRQTILGVIRHKTCLFIGISGDDGNMDSMLLECRDTHAYVLNNTAYWSVVFSTDFTREKSESWKSRRVYPKTIKDYKSDLPRILFGISQEATKRLSK